MVIIVLLMLMAIESIVIKNRPLSPELLMEILA